MHIRWYGQSAFLLARRAARCSSTRSATMEGLAARGLEFDYPPIEGVEADLLLVTHEHGDHNGVEAIGGSPQVIRSTAGTLRLADRRGRRDRFRARRRRRHEARPEHDLLLRLDGLRVCHFGDFGQAALRPEQQQAIGEVDVLFLPVGGGPTVGGEPAAAIVRALRPRLVVPMHYRTGAVNFLDPPDAFLDALGAESSASTAASSKPEPSSGPPRNRR